MPQLDFVTYLSQYFWLCVFYLALYYGATKYWLPRISRVLALRQAKLNESTNVDTLTSSENNTLNKEIAGIVAQAHKEARSSLDSRVQEGEIWTAATTKKILNTNFNEADKHYLRDMAQEIISQETAYYVAASRPPLAYSLLAFLNTLKSTK
jgi:hypothetical protein